MKLKEVSRSATVAWGPSRQHGSFLAAATVAGTMSTDFDTSGSLEIFSTDLQKMGTDMTSLGKLQTKERLHKLVWSPQVHPFGIIAGGLANGLINIWNPAPLIDGSKSQPLLASATSHTGPVYGLDFNPTHQNLLSSGGANGEVFIWDLQNPGNPTVYSPGTTGQQMSDVMSVQWNRKVVHILASATHSGNTVIWDLRAKRPVITFGDASRRIRCRSIAWAPDHPTSIITASEEDEFPNIQVWNLKNTYAPERTLQGHKAGILSVSWCGLDSSLLLSTAKDNRTLCWDTNQASVLCEVERGSSWDFDVQWSPSIPALASTCSLDGKIRLYSLQDFDTRPPAQETSTGDFFGMDPAGSTITPAAAAPRERGLVPKRPPGWLRRPVGATFAFGGKLIIHPRSTPRTGAPTDKKPVIKVAQIVTEKDLVQRAESLEKTVASSQFKEYCDEKIKTATIDTERQTWGFIKVFFEQQPRNHILKHLNFDPEVVSQRVSEFVNELPIPKGLEDAYKDEEDSESDTDEETEPKSHPEANGTQPTGAAAGVADLFGSGGGAEFDITPQPVQAEKKAKEPQEKPKPSLFPPGPPISLLSTDKVEQIITQALIIGDFTSAVDCCVKNNRMADALVLAACGGRDLWDRTQEMYFRQQNKTKPFAAIVASVVNKNLRELASRVDLKYWRDMLAILCTYAKSEEFHELCAFLGDRLKTEAHDEASATLCYICSSSIDKTINSWVAQATRGQGNSSGSGLQELVEKVVILSHAIEKTEPSELLAKKYSEYAETLAAQGKLAIALNYLETFRDPKFKQSKAGVLLDRLYHATSTKASKNPPAFPFDPVQVGSVGVVAAQTKPKASSPTVGSPKVPVAPQQQTGPFVPTPQTVPAATAVKKKSTKPKTTKPPAVLGTTKTGPAPPMTGPGPIAPPGVGVVGVVTPFVPLQPTAFVPTAAGPYQPQPYQPAQPYQPQPAASKPFIAPPPTRRSTTGPTSPEPVQTVVPPPMAGTYTPPSAQVTGYQPMPPEPSQPAPPPAAKKAKTAKIKTSTLPAVAKIPPPVTSPTAFLPPQQPMAVVPPTYATAPPTPMAAPVRQAVSPVAFSPSLGGAGGAVMPPMQPVAPASYAPPPVAATYAGTNAPTQAQQPVAPPPTTVGPPPPGKAKRK